MISYDELRSHLRWLIGGSIILGAMLMLTIFFVVIGSGWWCGGVVAVILIFLPVIGSYSEINDWITGESELPRLVEDYDEREGLQ